VVIV
jgi:hypothetical protein